VNTSVWTPMCVGVDVRKCGPVTVLLFLIDPVLASVSLVAWAWAAVRAASLSYAPTPRRLARGAGVVLGLVAFGVVLLFARATVLAGLAAEDWLLVREKVVLGLPLVGGPALAALALAVPRLVSLLRTAMAFSGIDAMPPSLRRDAAHPLVALPVELAAYGAVGAAAVLAFVSRPATAGSSLGLVTGVAVAALVTWWVAHVRHARLATDVVMPRLRPSIVDARIRKGTI
jgi:hypothetical protein